MSSPIHRITPRSTLFDFDIRAAMLEDARAFENIGFVYPAAITKFDVNKLGVRGHYRSSHFAADKSGLSAGRHGYSRLHHAFRGRAKRYIDPQKLIVLVYGAGVVVPVRLLSLLSFGAEKHIGSSRRKWITFFSIELL